MLAAAQPFDVLARLRLRRSERDQRRDRLRRLAAPRPTPVEPAPASVAPVSVAPVSSARPASVAPVSSARSSRRAVRNDEAPAHRATVHKLVKAFGRAEQRVRAALEELVDAEKEVNEAFLLHSDHLGTKIDVDASASGSADRFDDPELVVQRMRRSAWAIIAQRLELRRVMSNADKEELDKRLYPQVEHTAHKWPAVTYDNVLAFAAEYGDVARTFQRAVVEVFDWLRPSGIALPGVRQYKTNNPIEIGEKVVLDSFVKWEIGQWRVSHYQRQRLQALERVFVVLAGKGERTRHYQSDLETAIERAPKDGAGETEFFRFKCYKGTQTLHLWFKDQDLLRRLNQIAGGACLRPGEIKR